MQTTLKYCMSQFEEVTKKKNELNFRYVRVEILQEENNIITFYQFQNILPVIIFFIKINKLSLDCSN